MTTASAASRHSRQPARPSRRPFRARLVDNWTIEHSAAAPPPLHPAASGPVQTVELLPYGCTNLRIAEFPLAGEAGKTQRP